MDPIVETLSERLEPEVTRFCEKAGAIGASIGVVRDGELVWTYGYGLTDVDGDEAPGSDTLFRIASITKTFTATAIFLLRDRGLLNLDDPLAIHIPEFANAIPLKAHLEGVTLRRMLCHRSGLMSYAPTGGAYWSSGEFPSTSEILDAIPEIEVSIEPDSAFKYSNLAFGLLGEVIARVSGQPYDRFISSELLEPLGMESTTFEPNAELKSRTATGYEWRPNKEAPEPAPFPSYGGQRAAGQLYSTVGDLARWITLHLGPATGEESGSPVLTTRSRNEMQRTVLLEEDWRFGYALPWMMRRHNGATICGHDGAVHGFGSDIRFDADRQIGVIVLFNRVIGAGEISSKIFEIVSGSEKAPGAPLSNPEPDPEQTREPDRKPAPPPLGWEGYQGLYRGVLEITQKIEFLDGKLRTTVIFGSAAGQPVVLEPTGEPDTFRAISGRLSGDRVVFSRSGDGRVQGVIAEAMLFRKLPETADQTS